MTISEEQVASVTCTEVEDVPYSVTGGAPTNALTSRQDDEDQTVWKEIVDTMLAWHSDAGKFDPADQPDKDILDTAFDYAVDQITGGGAAPSNVVPSGSGRIAFEWNAGDRTDIVEFIAQGVATLTRFQGGRVVETGRLIRNPRSRKLEIEG